MVLTSQGCCGVEIIQLKHLVWNQVLSMHSLIIAIMIYLTLIKRPLYVERQCNIVVRDARCGARLTGCEHLKASMHT